MIEAYNIVQGISQLYCGKKTQSPKNPELHSLAGKKNPVKETARAMIRMTDDLNTKYLAQLSTRKSNDPITCGTCRQGMSHPAVFVPKKREPGNPHPEHPRHPTSPAL